MEVQRRDIYHAKVDTSRPFRSVKEALAIFGEKLPGGETCVDKQLTSPDRESAYYSPSSQRSSATDVDGHMLDDAVKKLEAELREVKMELKMLEGSESETDVAVFSPNSELQKNMLIRTLAKADTAEAISIGEKEHMLESKKKKKNAMKKHVLLLIGNLFPRKKQSSTTSLRIEDKAAAYYYTTSK